MQTLFMLLALCDLHDAISLNDLPLLDQYIQAGCDLNSGNKYGHTPLMYAIQKKNQAATDLLLDHASQIKLDQPDQHGITALSWAAMQNQTLTLQRLINLGANLHTMDQSGNTPALFSVIYKNKDALEVLIRNHADLDHPGMLDYAPLTYAIRMGGREDLFLMLIEGGASLSVKDKTGATPLILAVNYSSTVFAKILIDHHAGLNDQDDYGDTALMKAVSNSDQKMTKFLIDSGVGLEVKRLTGDTALVYATSLAMGETEIAKILIDSGANVNAVDNAGNSALINTTLDESLPTVRALLEKGADLEHQNNSGMNALMTAADIGNDEILKHYIGLGATLNLRTTGGLSALMLAQKASCEECVLALLSAGALPYLNDENAFSWDIDMTIPGRTDTFLHYLSPKKENHLILALKKGYFIPASKMIDLPGINLNQRDRHGSTALILAVKARKANLVEGLLLRYADRTIMDYDGKTALDYATELNYPEIITLLKASYYTK